MAMVRDTVTRHSDIGADLLEVIMVIRTVNIAETRILITLMIILKKGALTTEKAITITGKEVLTTVTVQKNQVYCTEKTGTITETEILTTEKTITVLKN